VEEATGDTVVSTEVDGLEDKEETVLEESDTPLPPLAVEMSTRSVPSRIRIDVEKDGEI